MITERVGITVRAATPDDDLTGLYPESKNRHLNLEQVLLATDQQAGQERLLGAAIFFHAGHDVAYLGAIRFSGSERQKWVVRAFYRAIGDWFRDRGVIEVLHSAGTRECAVAFERLGARPVRRDDLVLGLRLDQPAPTAPEGVDYPARVVTTLRFRFVSPFDEADKAQLRDLIIRTKARVQNRPWPWDFVLPTLGAWDEDQLIGYTQFSVGLKMTFQYGLRTDYPYRGQGLGTRLLALWLRIGRGMGAQVAISGALAGNTVMETLLAQAGFRGEAVPERPDVERLHVGDQQVFDWAMAQPEDVVSWP